MLAYHNKPELKVSILAMLAEHREADRLIKGNYWEHGKGCAVGCTLESIRVLEGHKTIEHQNHKLYERYLGVPRVLARLEDALFESLPHGESQAWPERFAAAIRPGADLSMVWPKFLHNLLSDPAGGVQKGLARSARPHTRSSVQAVIELYGRWIEGTKPSETEWRETRKNAAAAYAAAAADAAAEAAADAAYAAADAAAAAAYAADAAAAAAYADAAAAAATAAADAAAAYAAERIRQSNVLIALLEAA